MYRRLSTVHRTDYLSNFSVPRREVDERIRDVAQLVARHVRDVEVGSSSLLIPTKKIKIKAVVRSDYCLYCFLSIGFLSLLTVRIQVLFVGCPGKAVLVAR